MTQAMPPQTDMPIASGKQYFLPVMIGMDVIVAAILFSIETQPSDRLGHLLLFMLISPFLACLLTGETGFISCFFENSESTAFRDEVYQRPPLTHADFYTRFYEDSPIPFELVKKIRERCIKEVDSLTDRIVPSDKYDLLIPEIDLAVVIQRCGKLFGVKFTSADWKTIDTSFTFGDMIEMIYQKTQAPHAAIP